MLILNKKKKVRSIYALSYREQVQRLMRRLHTRDQSYVSEECEVKSFTGM